MIRKKHFSHLITVTKAEEIDIRSCMTSMFETKDRKGKEKSHFTDQSNDDSTGRCTWSAPWKPLVNSKHSLSINVCMQMFVRYVICSSEVCPITSLVHGNSQKSKEGIWKLTERAFLQMYELIFKYHSRKTWETTIRIWNSPDFFLKHSEFGIQPILLIVYHYKWAIWQSNMRKTSVGFQIHNQFWPHIMYCPRANWEVWCLGCCASWFIHWATMDAELNMFRTQS